VRNKLKVPIKAIKTYDLIFDTRYHLDLLEMANVTSLSRNFVSLPTLDFTGKPFNLSSEYFNLFKHSDLVSDNILYDSL